MPLNFPTNPNDGDTYENYVYDATPGVWRFNAQGQTLSNQIATLDGDITALETVVNNLGVPTTKVIDSDNINIDFSDKIPLETRAITGDVSVSGTNYGPGIKKTVLFESEVGGVSERNISFPDDWTFITQKPVTIPLRGKSTLEVNSFTSAASGAVAIWLGYQFKPPVATGGTESEIVIDGVTYKLHTFTESSSLLVAASGDTSVEYLVLAGGGGGASGWGNGNGAGGGGAGGLLTNLGTSSFVLDAQSYPVTVGQGGAGGSENLGTNLGGSPGTNGGNSSFADFIAIGGGGGGVGPGGLDGGSGGGGGPGSAAGLGTPGQGNDGGIGASQDNLYRGGGGGGRGSAGVSGVTSGNGGAGISSNISGTSIFYAAGGGGGVYAGNGSVGIGGSSIGGNGGNNGGAGGNAVSGRGSGGGGGGSPGTGGTGGVGGNGSDGVVFIRYPITDPN